MEEKVRSYGGHLTFEAELEIDKMVKEMEENGLEKKAVENAKKWVIEHPEYNIKIKEPVS